MIRIVSSFTLVLLFFGCYAQQTKQSDKEHKYELFFYPIGTPQNVRYSIIVNGDSIIAENHRAAEHNKKTYYVGKLSPQEKIELYSLYSKITTAPVFKSNPSLLDTWAVSLIVDNKKIYEVDDFSFESPPEDIRKLIKYIVKIGVIKIKLHGFA